MPRLLTGFIDENDCIGDSLDSSGGINPNFLALDEAVQSLSAYDTSLRQAITPISNNLTITNDLIVAKNIFQTPIITATGTFTTTTVAGDTVLRFTSSGTITVSNALGLRARVLVVGGGGGGGARYYAGGGGGGQVIDTFMTIPSGTSTVIVGAGGAGGVSDYVAGYNGQTSMINTLVAMGGGGGGSYNLNSGEGRPGASGGGDSGYYYSLAPGLFGNIGAGGQRNRGDGYGYAGGGGGGAGEAGTIGSSNGGNGGNGLASDITGSSVLYAAGGGGAAGNWSAWLGGTGGSGGGGNGASFNGAPTAGAANTGSGGGGAAGNAVIAGAAGGSGVVIIRYRL